MRERGEPRLPLMIYGVPLVGFRMAKNKSSSHLRGVVWDLEKGISLKIQAGRFWKIEVVRFRRLPTLVSRS